MSQIFADGGSGGGGGGSFTAADLTTSTTGITITGGTSAVNGAGTTVDIQTASGSQPGLLSASDWTTFNNKQSALSFGNLTDAGTDGITVTGGTGAVIGSGTSLSQHVADSTHNGYLSSTDWSTFNGKQNSLTIGNLTDAGTDGITVTSGTGAVIGSGTSLSQHVADSTHNGYLSSTDWTTFNNKTTLSGGTDERVVRWDGTTAVQSSTVSLTDAGVMAGVKTLAIASTDSAVTDLLTVSGNNTNNSTLKFQTTSSGRYWTFQANGSDFGSASGSWVVRNNGDRQPFGILQSQDVLVGQLPYTMPNGLGAALAIAAEPDVTGITGTTTVSSSTTVTGSGTKFTGQLGVGDRISVSSASTTYATITAIASDTSLTVDTALGNGTSQTINRKRGILRVATSTPADAFYINDQGNAKFLKTLSYLRTDTASTATINSFTVTSPFHKLTGTTATALNGITAGDITPSNGKTFVLYNGTNATLTVNHQSGSAAAADQINTPTGAAVSVLAGASVAFIYDLAATKWILYGGSATGSGITSINTDTTAAQTLTVGTSGTDFAIVDNGTGDHAFNLPSASATARGVVTTGAQTLAGQKTLSSAPILSSLTASTVPYLDASKVVTSSSVTPTELGYVSGVTSALQTQLDAKAANTLAFVTIGNTAGLTAERALTGTSNQITITDNGANSTVVLSTPQDIATGSSPTFVTETLSGLTASRPVFTDASKVLTSTGVSPIANGGTNNGSLSVTQGVVYYGDGSKLVGLATGTSGQFLQTQGSGANPQWASVTASATKVNISSNVTLASNTINFVDTSAARSLALPNPSGATTIIIKDVIGTASTNNITITRFGSEKIEGLAASYVQSTNWGSLTIVSDNTDWFFV